MDLTEAGKVKEVKPLFSKQDWGIEVMVLGRVIEVSAVQFWKVLLAKLVKLVGRVMEESLVQPLKISVELKAVMLVLDKSILVKPEFMKAC